MARIIERPREKEIQCGNCYALIGYDNSDVETITIHPPIGYYKLTEKYEPISIRFLVCPYCKKSICLDKRYENGLGN